MKSHILSLSVAAAALFPTMGGAFAQDSIADFYANNDITLVVGGAAGGGFDTYARLIARHMGKYIPGEPNIIVTNMPGSGSNIAAGHISAVAPQDGTHIVALLPGAIFGPLLGAQAQHDPAQLNYLGNANSDVYVCLLRADAGVSSFEEAFETELTIGATAPGASTRDFPALLANLLDVPFHIVAGYPGTADIANAVERGEVQGQCGTSWASISSSHARWFESGEVQVLVQEALNPHPELEAMGVPMALDYAADDEQRTIMELVYSQTVFGRPYALGPGVPQERVDALREAFVAALEDPDLQAEAERANLELDYLGGPELQELIENLFATPPELLEQARAVLASE